MAWELSGSNSGNWTLHVHIEGSVCSEIPAVHELVSHFAKVFEACDTFSPSPHSLSHTASLFLIYMETLIGQIEDIIKNEKRKQVWVPVVKNES